MKIRTGNMFTDHDKGDYLFVTTNSYIKKDGSLVMGRGAALEAKNLFRYIDKQLGNMISKHETPDEYGLVLTSCLGAFQVKRHFRDAADLDLIRMSTAKLKELAESNPELTYSINFPGIGFGWRDIEEVMPIIETLPNNVTVWRKTNG